ncbi:hypothetical protein SNEBB_007047 [Seison nebaliae]|nr:hypothetical protein SNEBB_007047 [Seison nebaliae]
MINLLSEGEQKRQKDLEVKRKKNYRLQLLREQSKNVSREMVSRYRKKKCENMKKMLENRFVTTKIELSEKIDESNEILSRIAEEEKMRELKLKKLELEREEEMKRREEKKKSMKKKEKIRFERAINEVYEEIEKKQEEKENQLILRQNQKKTEDQRRLKILEHPLPSSTIELLETNTEKEFLKRNNRLSSKLKKETVERMENGFGKNAYEMALEMNEFENELKEEKEKNEEESNVLKRVRGLRALEKELLEKDYENIMNDVQVAERESRQKLHNEMAQFPPSIFRADGNIEKERDRKEEVMEKDFEKMMHVAPTPSFSNSSRMRMDERYRMNEMNRIDELELSDLEDEEIINKNKEMIERSKEMVKGTEEMIRGSEESENESRNVEEIVGKKNKEIEIGRKRGESMERIRNFKKNFNQSDQLAMKRLIENQKLMESQPNSNGTLNSWKTDIDLTMTEKEEVNENVSIVTDGTRNEDSLIEEIRNMKKRMEIEHLSQFDGESSGIVSLNEEESDDFSQNQTEYDENMEESFNMTMKQLKLLDERELEELAENLTTNPLIDEDKREELKTILHFIQKKNDSFKQFDHSTFINRTLDQSLITRKILGDDFMKNVQDQIQIVEHVEYIPNESLLIQSSNIVQQNNFSSVTDDQTGSFQSITNDNSSINKNQSIKSNISINQLNHHSQTNNNNNNINLNNDLILKNNEKNSISLHPISSQIPISSHTINQIDEDKFSLAKSLLDDLTCSDFTSCHDVDESMDISETTSKRNAETFNQSTSLRTTLVESILNDLDNDSSPFPIDQSMDFTRITNIDKSTNQLHHVDDASNELNELENLIKYSLHNLSDDQQSEQKPSDKFDDNESVKSETFSLISGISAISGPSTNVDKNFINISSDSSFLRTEALCDRLVGGNHNLHSTPTKPSKS